jgi:hypothetical protein
MSQTKWANGGTACQEADHAQFSRLVTNEKAIQS